MEGFFSPSKLYLSLMFIGLLISVRHSEVQEDQVTITAYICIWEYS